MQAEENPETFLIQNLLWSSIFLCSCARRNQMTSPTDFFHSLRELFHTFAGDWFPDLHFPLILTKGIKKRGFPAKQSQAKVLTLSHGTFYFITFSSPRWHSQTWLIIVPHNTCKKWLNFLFQHPQGKMWCCRIRLSCITYHYKIETTSQLVLLITRAF